MKREKVPPTYSSTPGASHDPALHYQVQDEKGNVKTYFLLHPAGNRKQRRYRQRHHPFYTKSAHPGRDWWRLLDARKDKSDDKK